VDEHVVANGIRLHLVSEGPADGPLVVLLHGFPEFWWSWRKQIGPLAEKGYRVFAPDQRGYNTSDKPNGVAAYRLDLLAKDVIGLIDRAGVEKAYIVGHDWGGMVAWWIGLRFPERAKKIVILNVPHPRVMTTHMFRSAAQLRKSWYTLFFQLPYLPERVAFVGKDGARMAGVFETTSRPGTFSDADLEQYKEAWRQPGAARAMIHWYRAALTLPFSRRLDGGERVRVPLMLIWGTGDQVLGEEMAPMSIALCDAGRLERIATAGHWVHHEEPERVNQLLLDFLR
jgi:pimeloyl-ACP methyl ester carboxylesterase